VSKYARSTLEVLAATIREFEQKADQAGQKCDGLLVEAREVAQERSSLMTQATNLREILSDADSKYYATYVSMFGEPFDPNADPTREQFADALRDAAAYLESTPQLPIGERGHITIKTTGSTPAELRADLDRVAAIMGVEAREVTSYGNHKTYAATLDFGPVYLYASVDVPNEPQPEATAAEQDQADDDEDPYQTYLAEHPFGDEDQVPEGQCGAKAVNPDGETGRCTLDAGHDDPDSPAYNCQQTDGHFDRSFGFWSQRGERTFLGRGKHAPSLGDDTRCAECGLAVGVGYCFGPSHDAAAVSAGAR
jgi:hypothetical protein